MQEKNDSKLFVGAASLVNKLIASVGLSQIEEPIKITEYKIFFLKDGTSITIPVNGNELCVIAPESKYSEDICIDNGGKIPQVDPLVVAELKESYNSIGQDSVHQGEI